MTKHPYPADQMTINMRMCTQSRNGRLAAVLVSVSDLEALEAFEDAQDVDAFRAAKAQDDGTRVSLEELRRELRS